MLIPRVTKVEHVAGYRLRLWFADGAVGVVDLESELWGEVFEPLRDLSAFRQVFVSGETICWPNGADLAPEFLRERLEVSATAA